MSFLCKNMCLITILAYFYYDFNPYFHAKYYFCLCTVKAQKHNISTLI